MRRWWVSIVGLFLCWASACQPVTEDPPTPTVIDAGVAADGGLADSGAPDSGVVPIDGGFAEDTGVEPDAGAPDVGRSSIPSANLAWEALPSGTPEDLERWGGPLVLIPEEHRTILFGGTHYPRRQGVVNDLWSYDLNTGTWTSIPTTGDVPEPRYCDRGVYLPTTHELLVVGGRNNTGNGILPRMAATLDLTTYEWKLVTGDVPLAIVGAAMEWMPNLDRAIVFGGSGTRGNETLTWSYDPSLRTFSLLNPATVPPGRADAATAYDPINERMLMFGGGVRVYPPFEHLNDLWAYDGVDWTELHPAVAPSARRYMAGGIDPITGLWVLFGGTKDDLDYDDLWFYDLGTDTFARQTTTSTPTARGFSAYTFDPEGGQLIIFGGLEVPFLDPLADGWRLPL